MGIMKAPKLASHGKEEKIRKGETPLLVRVKDLGRTKIKEEPEVRRCMPESP